jgi:hypothetical protein
MPSLDIGTHVFHIASLFAYHPGTITNKFAEDMYEISYDTYGKCVVHEDDIYNDLHRNVEEVESYADVDDDVLDIEMKMEKDEDELYDENKEWEVDDILGRRNGKEEVEFLVKWKDCKGFHDNTWEPFSVLSENKLLLEYIEEWMLIHQPMKIEVN